MAADLVWLDLWDLPSCCTALSALQGSCSVMCTRCLWLAQFLSACRDIPVLAASDITATNFRPLINSSLCTNDNTKNIKPYLSLCNTTYMVENDMLYTGRHSRLRKVGNFLPENQCSSSRIRLVLRIKWVMRIIEKMRWNDFGFMKLFVILKQIYSIVLKFLLLWWTKNILCGKMRYQELNFRKKTMLYLFNIETLIR